MKIVTSLFLLIFSLHWFLGKSIDLNRNTDLLPPCNEPISFSIGDVDDRFSISKGELAEIITHVTEVWSDVLGVPTATYTDDNGDVSIHLIYDEQQQLTDNEREFSNSIRQRETLINEIESRYRLMLDSYNVRTSVYQDESHQLQRRIDVLNKWVNERNREGGFNETQIQEFERRRHEIDQESALLNNEALSLKQKADEINGKMSRLNHEINRKNDLVREYNERFSGTRRFTQGTFEWRGNRKWINIFQFANKSELELVIAHEIGHALGLDHVDNPASVMYHLMGRQETARLTLTHEDRRALRDRCGL